MKKQRNVLAHDEQLMKAARSIARLESKARSLRYQLKETTRELREARRGLKAYAQNIVDHKWNEQAPPMRTFGEKL
jgi:septal ring factor EnvC (AmiA/AmiB activator)